MIEAQRRRSLISSRLNEFINPPYPGFTLVEVLIASLILSIATLGTIALISTSRRQVMRSGEINEINALIEADLTSVRTANDRLICNDGTCRLSETTPTKTDYFPSVGNPGSLTTSEKSNIRFLERRCAYLSSSGTFDKSEGLAWQLRSLLPDAAPQIKRTISDAAIDSTGHRYTVTYTRTGGDSTILRQVTLVPTTIAWCPCVPSTITTSSSDPNRCPLTDP